MARITIDLPGITANRMQEVIGIVATALKGHIRESDHPLWIVDTNHIGSQPPGASAPPENLPEKPDEPAVCICNVLTIKHGNIIDTFERGSVGFNEVAGVKGAHHTSTMCLMYEFDVDSIPF